ncbi:hypothetical protein Q2337_26800, partial [Escherichia coli]|nr:hypothetical protein [Escherichia coli]
MAEQIVDRVFQIQHRPATKTKTAHIPLSGGDVDGSSGFKEFKAQKMQRAANLLIPEAEAALLIQRYGSNVEKLFGLYGQASSSSIDSL